jgi:hypothetical protein
VTQKVGTFEMRSGSTVEQGPWATDNLAI